MALTTQAAPLNMGDMLTISAGVPVFDSYGYQVNVSSGSWFAMEGDNNAKIVGVEKVAIVPGPGGIVIGQTRAPGEIDSWSFYGFGGNHWLPSPVPPGSTTSGLDFSGWTVRWNGGDIPMGSGAWNPLNCGTLGSPCAFTNGVAAFSWSGIYGDSYSLWYTATVPSGDFAGVQYMLHLEGTVMSAVPLPAAFWLFGSGLLGLSGFARLSNRWAASDRGKGE